MNSLQEAFTRAQASWQSLVESDKPIFRVGSATCGRAAGAGKVIDRLREEIDTLGIDARIVEVGCLGPCYLEPLVEVRKPGTPAICYGRVGPAQISTIVKKFILGDDPCAQWALGQLDPVSSDGAMAEIGKLDDHVMMNGQVRNVLRNCGLIDPENVDHYLARDGYRGALKALEMGPVAVLAAVRESGLRGRGGAGFPTWRKWDLCRKAAGEPKYLICNADEGDPGAFMNRSLLEGDPHAVLEGMLIAGYTLGASKGYVYCRAEYPLALRRLDIAIGQMRELGLLGDNIQGSDFSFDIVVKKGAGAFVCGEETALIASIEGLRGMPNPRPPFPATSGLWGRPTIIQNVETLGTLAQIIKRGPAWYTQWGTPTSRGTKTFALAGKVKNTGLVEVPMGTTLHRIVEEIGGGVPDGKTLKAVQTGGPSGGCIPASQMGLPVDYDSLSKAGSIMGSGGMIVLDEDTCIVDIARYFLSFTQEESCGKCPPCRVGTRAMLAILEDLTNGRGEANQLPTLERLADTVAKGSLCGLGQTAPNPVLTTLRYFREEYEEHIHNNQCRAFSCQKLVWYHIDLQRCEGCGNCAKVCPAEAISGIKDESFSIDTSLCTQCGACLPVCPPATAAVFRTSGDLSRYEEQKSLKKRKP